MNIIPIQAPSKVNDWEGLYVRSLRKMRNFYMVFPENTIFVIETSGPKKYLRSLPCKCCGVQGLIALKTSRKEFLLDFSFVELEGE